mmetsp:Transcript_11327/g.37829  ORF Transcript_11327/g.37829 Transcript_11327/m.37829 type:complete len:241 (+) Transcript_11327:386-1108(+)
MSFNVVERAGGTEPRRTRSASACHAAPTSERRLTVSRVSKKQTSPSAASRSPTSAGMVAGRRSASRTRQSKACASLARWSRAKRLASSANGVASAASARPRSSRAVACLSSASSARLPQARAARTASESEACVYSSKTAAARNDFKTNSASSKGGFIGAFGAVGQSSSSSSSASSSTTSFFGLGLALLDARRSEDDRGRPLGFWPLGFLPDSGFFESVFTASLASGLSAAAALAAACLLA